MPGLVDGGKFSVHEIYTSAEWCVKLGTGTFVAGVRLFDPDLFFLITDLAMYLAAAGLPSAFGRAVIPVSRLHSVGAPTLNQLHPSVAQVSNIPSFA